MSEKCTSKLQEGCLESNAGFSGKLRGKVLPCPFSNVLRKLGEILFRPLPLLTYLWSLEINKMTFTCVIRLMCCEIAICLVNVTSQF